MWLNTDEIKTIKQKRGSEKLTVPQYQRIKPTQSYQDYVKQAVKRGQIDRIDGEDSIRKSRGVTSFYDEKDLK